MIHLSRKFAVIVLAFAATITLAWAEDEVTRRQTSIPFRGTITAESATEITIQRKDTGKSETVSVHDVAKVKYEGGKAAAEFTQAESLERGGEHQKAIDAYKKIADENTGKEFFVRAANFGRVSSINRIAQRDASRVDEAIKAIEDFRKDNPDSRYHFALHEMLGLLQLSKGNTSAAGAAFAELGKAPWADFKLKSANYAGRILIVSDQFDAAIAKFDAVAQSAGDSAEEKIRRFEALLGKAECLVKQKKFEEAEKLLGEVIDGASSEESALHATAFNFRGDVQRETGRPKEAILSYLYVDLICSGDREQHAKSLCFVALLSDQLGRADRAEDYRSRLKKDYPSSPWAKVVDAGAKTEQ
jgi:tetratricopeptide (TPR) repeat protein